MKVLVLNCGSSSIKYKLFEMTTKEVLAQGGIEKIGLPGSFLKLTLPNGEKKVIEKDVPEHTTGVQFIFDTLTNAEYGAVSNLHEIKAVGHRVLHGGTKFSGSVLIDDAVIAAVEECCDLGPLHNPANLKGIYAVQKLLPEVPQVAVFDTAFHQTMPDYAYLYPIPYKYFEKYGIRRYGFHGTSHRYVSKRVCEFLNIPQEGSRIITCHIGNGGSIAAVKDGKCIDTTMGLTPLEGLMMGTRCGDIDGLHVQDPAHGLPARRRPGYVVRPDPAAYRRDAGRDHQGAGAGRTLLPRRGKGIHRQSDGRSRVQLRGQRPEHGYGLRAPQGLERASGPVPQGGRRVQARHGGVLENPQCAGVRIRAARHYGTRQRDRFRLPVAGQVRPRA